MKLGKWRSKFSILANPKRYHSSHRWQVRTSMN